MAIGCFRKFTVNLPKQWRQVKIVLPKGTFPSGNVTTKLSQQCGQVAVVLTGTAYRGTFKGNQTGLSSEPQFRQKRALAGLAIEKAILPQPMQTNSQSLATSAITLV